MMHLLSSIYAVEFDLCNLKNSACQKKFLIMECMYHFCYQKCIGYVTKHDIGIPKQANNYTLSVMLARVLKYQQFMIISALLCMRMLLLIINCD